MQLKAKCVLLNHDYLTLSIELWWALLLKVKVTLIMVMIFRCGPIITACAALEEEFQHNGEPLSPLGSIAIVERTSSQRASLAPRNGTKVWLIGPVSNYYRSAALFIYQTKGSSVVDTFRWSE